MPERRIWKVATFVALGVAALALLRPAHRRPEIAAAADTCRGRDGADRGERRASGPRYRVINLHDRVAELAARLAAARTTSRACRLFTELARTDADEVAAVIAEGVRTRRNVEARACGVEALALLGGPDALAQLTALVDDPDAGVRRAALRGLAASGAPDAVGVVFAAAQREDLEPRRRIEALLALGDAHVREAAPLIAAALETAVGMDLPALLSALGDAGDPGAVSALMRFTRSPSAYARDAAFHALGTLDGPEVVAALREVLTTGARTDVFSAAQALADSREPTARAALLAAAETEGTAGDAAAGALSGLEGDDVRAVMATLLARGDREGVALALHHAVARRDAQALPRIAELAQSPRFEIAMMAIDALASFDGDATARAALEAAAQRPGNAQGAALRALSDAPETHAGAIATAVRVVREEGGSSAHEAMRLLAEDASPAARDALIELARTGGNLGTVAVEMLATRRDDESRRLVADLAEHGASSNGPNTRAAALEVMGQTGGPESERALLAALRGTDGFTQSVAANALASLGTASARNALLELASARGTSAEARESALRALSENATPATAAQLERLATDPSSGVAQMALLTVARATPERAAPLIAAAAHSSDAARRAEAVRAAQALDPEAARPVLLAALSDPESDVAMTAIDTLAEHGGREAQQQLVALLTREGVDEQLRRSAARALDNIGGEARRAQSALIERWLADPTAPAGDARDEGADDDHGAPPANAPAAPPETPPPPPSAPAQPAPSHP